MNMTAGLTVPTSGTATVLGGHPAGSAAALNGVAFVAQDAPVYRNLSARDMLHLTRNLNQHFDTEFARARLADLGIPLNKKAGRLSGGQQSQLALTLALARRPRLLILDEPLAALDPIARQDFLAAVMTTWRQHRAALISVPAVLAAVAVFLVIFGLKAHHDYAALVHCSLNPGQQTQPAPRRSAISTPATGRWRIPARS